MLACLDTDVAHHVNEGRIRVGKIKFAEFCAHMSHCYREELTDMVVFEAEGGTRAAAEYIVNGTYLATDAGLPEARGQTYRLPAGSFFDIKDGKIRGIVHVPDVDNWADILTKLKTAKRKKEALRAALCNGRVIRLH